MFDVSWVAASEVSPSSHVLVALADGSIQLYNVQKGQMVPGAVSSTPPRARWPRHVRETCCVQACLLQADKFLSTSYDGAIKVSRLDRPDGSQMFTGHQGIVYQGRWSPGEASAFLSVGADRTVRLWDDRRPPKAITSLPAHEDEILTVDWNDSNPLQFATGSTDCTVKIWDWRSVRSGPLQTLRGHYRAVKRIRWPAVSRKLDPDAPFPISRQGNFSQLYTSGYDMALRVWRVEGSMNPFVGSWEGHTEFVTGVDVSPTDGLVATCAWDQTICLLRSIHWGQAY